MRRPVSLRFAFDVAHAIEADVAFAFGLHGGVVVGGVVVEGRLGVADELAVAFEAVAGDVGGELFDAVEAVVEAVDEAGVEFVADGGARGGHRGERGRSRPPEWIEDGVATHAEHVDEAIRDLDGVGGGALAIAVGGGEGLASPADVAPDVAEPPVAFLPEVRGGVAVGIVRREVAGFVAVAEDEEVFVFEGDVAFGGRVPLPMNFAAVFVGLRQRTLGSGVKPRSTNASATRAWLR